MIFTDTRQSCLITVAPRERYVKFFYDVNKAILVSSWYLYVNDAYYRRLIFPATVEKFVHRLH